MKPVISILLAICMLVLPGVVPVRAQHTQAQSGDSIKAKIERLESTDIKTKSATVQDIYRRSLLRLYSQYVAALEQDIEDLEKISAATGETNGEAASQIRRLMGEKETTKEKIQTLTGDLQTAASSSDAPAGGFSETGAATSNRAAGYAAREQPAANQRPNAAQVSAPTTSRTESFGTAPASDPGALRSNFQPAGLRDDDPPATPPAPAAPSGPDTPPPDPNAMEIDWPSRTAGCPVRVTQSSTRTKVHVTGVNDLLIDFRTGQRLEYKLQAKGTPVSAVPPESPTALTSEAGFADPTATCQLNGRNFGPRELRAKLAAIRNFVMRTPDISPPGAGGKSISLETTRNAALHSNDSTEVNEILSLLDDSSCSSLFNSPDFKSHPVMNWLRRINGSHTYDFNIVLEPNQNYEFTLKEFWRDEPTQGGTVRQDCGENEIFSLSLGPLVSTLPQRSYTHQKALVPPGSSTTQDVLTVQNSRNISVLGAALLNYHFPRFGSLPRWTGLTLSAGPVYTLGGTPGVSPLGLFVGTSIHLNRSMFITPGVHIGQFADFPSGFAPGTVIPDQFGDLNPVKRTTAHFAIGLTYKTNTFKKSSDSGGTATTGGTDKPPEKPPTQ